MTDPVKPPGFPWESPLWFAGLPGDFGVPPAPWGELVEAFRDQSLRDVAAGFSIPAAVIQEAKASATPSLDELVEAFRNLPAPPKRTAIVTHPDNKRHLDAMPPEPSVVSDRIAALPLAGAPIVFSKAVPARSIREVWHPPDWGPYVTFAPADEWWARPAGLGRVETIDDGPAFYEIPEELL